MGQRCSVNWQPEMQRPFGDLENSPHPKTAYSGLTWVATEALLRIVAITS